MTHYYNEWEPYAAEWLRNLGAAGHIPTGTVDERSIQDVEARDVEGFTQAHFFAGIGGWPLALRLAGWPENRPVWTGSCPCQPFSVAGKGRGDKDERHLWPEFRRLIGERRPPVVFGEQVASKDGRLWLAGVRADLEGLGYAVGAADLCAAGVEAPHIRQRLFWVAESEGLRHGPTRVEAEPRRRERPVGPDGVDVAVGVDVATADRRQHDAEVQGRDGEGDRQRGTRSESGNRRLSRFWDAFDVIPCRDGKARRVEPGTFPLADGVPARVGKLRSYGNAIVPPLAAEFVRAFMLRDEVA